MSGPPVWEVVPAAAAVVGLGVIAAVIDAVVPDGGRPSSVGRRAARPLADVARLLRQRRRTTRAPDVLLWQVGLAGPLLAALLMGVALPLLGRPAADLPAGIVWLNAVDIALWAAIWLAGWGPNSVHGLVGGYRFLAQALAYELPLMFSLICPAVAAHSLRINDVVAEQHHLWFIVQMPLAFVVLVGSVMAFSVWGPLAHPAGSDIAGGVLAEPSGVDRLILQAGRCALLAVGAATAVTLFLAGGEGPVLPGWAWMLVKTITVLTVMVSLGRRLPVVRADRLMGLAWLAVLPATLAQVLVVSAIAVIGA